MTAEPPSVFISYRRDDTSAWAHAIRTEMAKTLPNNQIYLDTTSVPVGTPFPENIRSTISSSKIVVALIGRFWETDASGHALLTNEHDWIRQELLLARQYDVPVAPLFFDGCSFATLTIPPELAWLHAQNGKSVHLENPGQDIQRIVDEIVDQLPPSVKLNAPQANEPATPPTGATPTNWVGSITGNNNKTNIGNNYGQR